MNKPSNPKERNLLKGAVRRIFSRSDLRREVLKAYGVEHSDPNRTRVKRWAYCAVCGIIEAASYMEVDHIEPIVPLNRTLEDMSWDEVVDRIWCDKSNLQVVCETCHKSKSKAENKERRSKKCRT